jgi:hypothetical protein
MIVSATNQKGTVRQPEGRGRRAPLSHAARPRRRGDRIAQADGGLAGQLIDKGAAGPLLGDNVVKFRLPRITSSRRSWSGAKKTSC